jgi:ubiquinone/menaquinone biosynthesis C-methylase UbiE
MKRDERVRRFFQQRARQFDRLYHDTAGIAGLLNRWMRRPLYHRLQLTLAACADVRGKRILDVGCGSGRYAIALAEKGANVVGIDFASNMLTLARQLARQRGVASRCHFVDADFLEHDFRETFHISLAIGLFDYVAEPADYLSRLRRLTSEKVILSFPRPGGWRALQRWLRYRLQGCPIYFHSRESMEACLAAAGFERWDFVGSWAVAMPPVGANASAARLLDEDGISPSPAQI